MNDYIQINDENEMNEIDKEFAGFHDCLLKEVHLINRAFTDSKNQMFMNFKIDAELYFQSQYKRKGLYILCENVIQYSMKEQDEVYEGHGLVITNYNKMNEEKQKEIVFRIDSDMLQISCRKAAYKIEENSFGSKARLKAEIPNIEMLPAEILGSNVRLCGGCANVIEVDDSEKFVFCESCYSVTVGNEKNPTTAST